MVHAEVYFTGNCGAPSATHCRRLSIPLHLAPVVHRDGVRVVNVNSPSFRRFERRFYLGLGVAFAALVFYTFARSYYLKWAFSTPPLPQLIHIHGVVMTGWVVLFIAQSGLIVAQRVNWHRQLGTLGAAWAVLVVILGSTTTLHAASREVHAHSRNAGIQVAVTGLELVQMVLFAGLVVTAVLQRHHPAVHKRLMLLTLACMLPSAVSRLPLDFIDNTVILVALDAFVLGCVAIDSVRHRRLHPAFAWGAAVFLAAMNLAFYAVMTPWWQSLGARLVS